jgi:hypothetical protein
MYVYKVYYDLNTGASAWFPCEPSQVQFAYSVLGIEDLTPPNVSVICPNGMEYYKTGQTIPIDWNVIDEYLQGIMCSVSINYESGNGIWVVLGSNIPVDEEGHGQFSYHIPSGQPSAKEHCRIRVIANDTNYHQGIDMSDSDFTIEYLQKPDGEPIPNNGNAEIPENHFLATPVPNPFNPSTDIRFGIKEPAVISLRIFDVAGRVVKTFYRDSYLPAGMYHEVWNGLDDNGVPVDSGVFFLQFKAGSFIETRKLVLMK